MPHRRSTPKPRARGRQKPSRGVHPKTASPTSSAFPYPVLTDFLENGHGTLELGHLPWSGFGAVVSDDDVAYVTLWRREGDSIADLLARLEVALPRALETGEPFTEFPE